jgi:hypothetical protein
MTDIKKYKSVAISIDTYKRAKPIAEKNYMSMASFLRYLIDKEEDRPTLKNGEDTSCQTPRIEESKQR